MNRPLGANTSFTYDGDGNRIRKVRGNTTVEYIVIGGVIYAESRQAYVTNDLHYLFDENGTRIGFVHNGTNAYYYRFNLQGDVTGIYSSTGNLIVEYTYDAWGKLEDMTGSALIGLLNPIRYRGYYYDIETGLYYLQTRYYDPETGRFINADSLLNQESVLGNNMFAYCLNNPINMADPSGQLAISIVVGGVVLACGLALVAGAMLSDPNIRDSISEATKSLAKTGSDLTSAVKKKASKAKEKNNSKKSGRTYSVYFLKDENDTIQYVGRVTDEGYKARMKYHQKTRGLVPAYRVSGLSLAEARGLEEIGMITCHTLNSSNPINNQIHGISPLNKSRERYMVAASNYMANKAENELLNILEN